MSRRPASCLQVVLAVISAVGPLAGCGGSEREARTPPPITASMPAETAEPAPAKAAAPQTESAPAPAVVVPTPAASADSDPAPASTPGTSLPGAIPPSPAPDANAPPPERAVDPLQRLRDGQARKAEYQRKLGEADANLVNADTKVAEWEKNALAFANPFLARPQLSPEDSSAIAGMDGAERVAWAKGRLAEARAGRDAAQKALDDLKANPPLN